MTYKQLLAAAALTAFLPTLLTGCMTLSKPFDYTAFKESRPKSVLVLPPLNNSPDVKASLSMLSKVTYPLAESGYYVMPVTLVEKILKENGMTTPADIHLISRDKLTKIFGADAVLYITVTHYGTTYHVIDSETRVSVKAELIDLKTGIGLWSGAASASSYENANQSHGLFEQLFMAAVKQIANTVADASSEYAGVAAGRLLSAGRTNGLLYGPRALEYGTD